MMISTRTAWHRFLGVCLLVAICGCDDRPTGVEADLASLLPAADSTSRQQGDDEWAQALQPRRFEFPRDHGAHRDYRIEWWYYTGNLRTPAGRRFGYQLTFFRTGLRKNPTNPSRWAVRDLYIAHFAVSDIQQEQHHVVERVNRKGIGLAGAAVDHYKVWNGDWRVEQIGEEHHLVANEDDLAILLTLKPTKPFVLHGDDGLSRKGPTEGNASYYYSSTRMDTVGTVSVGGASHEVRGESWMDHEFSTSFLEESQLGWDWFSIQLDNQVDIMLYQMRRKDGSKDPFSSGSVVDQAGWRTHLSASDFILRPQATWRSNATDAEYPLRWQIELPTLDYVLDVEPAFESQEMTTHASIGVTYWEGSIRVSGRTGEQNVRGHGYLELTGYSGKSLGTLVEE